MFWTEFEQKVLWNRKILNMKESVVRGSTRNRRKLRWSICIWKGR